METILLNTTPLREGCWLTRINSAYLGRLAPDLSPETSTSVILVDEAEYDEKGEALVVRGAPIRPLAIGISDTAIVLTREAANLGSKESHSDRPLDGGDQAFLNETRWLPTWAQEAARHILSSVREIDDGKLSRGERNKFVNRPDNFWTITAQPRKGGFAVTIYGRPHLFQAEHLTVLNDRPGHSRFVIRDAAEVPEAIRLIKRAKELKS